MTLRILTIGNLYPPHHLGGYELLWRDATHALRAAGHDVRVLASTHREPGVQEDDEPGVHRALRWYWEDHAFPPVSFRERLGIERDNAEVFDRHVAEHEPDVVAFWAMGGMSLGLIARARRAELPALFVVIDAWPQYAPAADRWQATWRVLGPARGLPGRALRRPSAVDLGDAGPMLFCSRAMQDVTRVAGHHVRDGRVIHPGIDATRFSAAPERAAWGGALLALGRLDPRKGFDTAIAAAGALGSEAALTIVGDGEKAERERLRALAGEGVRFVAKQPAREIAATIAAHDAVLFPVRWQEPWGLVPLEAMSVGRPVIATGLGGSGEYLRDGVNCLLVAPDDPAALADAVRRLAADRALRGHLVAGGRETAAAHPQDAWHAALEAVHREIAR